MERLRMSQPIEPSSRIKKKDIQIRKKHDLYQKTQTSRTLQHYCHGQENPLGNRVKHGIAN